MHSVHPRDDDNLAMAPRQTDEQKATDDSENGSIPDTWTDSVPRTPQGKQIVEREKNTHTSRQHTEEEAYAGITKTNPLYGMVRKKLMDLERFMRSIAFAPFLRLQYS